MRDLARSLESPDARARPPRALVADDEEGIRFVLGRVLRQEGCEVDEVGAGDEAVARAETTDYDLYVLDMKMPRKDGMTALREIRRRRPGALVLMITAFGSREIAMEALQAGAYDFFTKPFELDDLRVVLRRALERRALERELRALRESLSEGREGLGRIIGSTEGMRQVYDLIRRVAEHDITVLVTGESGVGKELVAEAVHELGRGADRPFVRVNCAAIPEPLLESELFGHERGAFTGAVASKPGKFEIAHGGSILLDEIGEMPLQLQAKLLRVLQQKVVERVGDTRSRPVDVRVIASTNRDLAAMVRERTFREDLYFRIAVVPIHVPPLRERREDVPMLVEHFLEKFNRRGGRTIAGVTPEALAALEAWDWPGNVRELENTLHRAMVMTSGVMIDLESLPPAIARRAATPASAPVAGPTAERAPRTASPAPAQIPRLDPNATPLPGFELDPRVEELFDSGAFVSLQDSVDKVVEEEERKIILSGLRRMNQKRQETADLLGISRKSLHNKMAKYGLLRSRETYDTKDES